MAVVQVSARIDGKTKKQAEKVFGEYGLDISTAIRSMVTIAANTRRMPFAIGEPAPAPVPAPAPAKKVSLNGDEFESETEYAKQIPGYWESILEGCNEAHEDCVEYDSEEFWKRVKELEKKELENVEN